MLASGHEPQVKCSAIADFTDFLDSFADAPSDEGSATLVTESKMAIYMGRQRQAQANPACDDQDWSKFWTKCKTAKCSDDHADCLGGSSSELLSQKGSKTAACKHDPTGCTTPLTSSTVGSTDNSTYSANEQSDSDLLLPAVQRGLKAVSQMVQSDEMVVIADQEIKAFVAKDVVRTWSFQGAGAYRLRITRVSGFTACCKGTCRVIAKGTGDVIWEKSGWRSSKNGVDETISITTHGDCIVELTMRAHHFSSSLFRIGRSVARVCITQTASLDKGRLRRARRTPSGSSFSSGAQGSSSTSREYSSSRDVEPVCSPTCTGDSVGASSLERLVNKISSICMRTSRSSRSNEDSPAVGPFRHSPPPPQRKLSFGSASNAAAETPRRLKRLHTS